MTPRLSPILILTMLIAVSLARGQDRTRKGLFYVRPSINSLSMGLQQSLNSSLGIYAEGGYQINYIPEYKRASRIQSGILPLLSSYGYLGEFGVSFSKPTHNLRLGVQYKRTRIDTGTDIYAEAIGLSVDIWENTYSRLSHRITLKLQWDFYPDRIISPYLGSGLRYVYLQQTPINVRERFQSNIFWFAPTLHAGVRITFFQWPKTVEP